jgi:hypothetical protein
MNDQQTKYFNVLIQTYTRQQDIEVNDRCNGWTARNIGDDTVTINGIALLPRIAPGLSGESVSVGGNETEIYTGRLQVSFAGVGANPLVEVTQKFFVDKRQ